jgi:hypothetical protein
MLNARDRWKRDTPTAPATASSERSLLRWLSTYQMALEVTLTMTPS